MITSSGQFDLEGRMRIWGEMSDNNVAQEKAAAVERMMEAEQNVYDLVVEAGGDGEGTTGDEFFGDTGDSLCVMVLRKHIAALGGHLELCECFPTAG